MRSLHYLSIHKTDRTTPVTTLLQPFVRHLSLAPRTAFPYRLNNQIFYLFHNIFVSSKCLIKTSNGVCFISLGDCIVTPRYICLVGFIFLSNRPTKFEQTYNRTRNIPHRVEIAREIHVRSRKRPKLIRAHTRASILIQEQRSRCFRYKIIRVHYTFYRDSCSLLLITKTNASMSI